MSVQEEQKRSKNFITALLFRATAYELSILLASALAAGGVWIFVEIADEVFEGETRRLDEAILLSLRNTADLVDPIGPSWFEEMMGDLPPSAERLYSWHSAWLFWDICCCRKNE